ncbi:hypothetical protein [Allokutzneria oryzae]|uniref:SH3 domain-containing protein n=1 Tax=Allokutzneria oryzae TaxID=1378989 RepID=A0ABV6A1M8_9PSEU
MTIDHHVRLETGFTAVEGLVHRLAPLRIEVLAPQTRACGNARLDAEFSELLFNTRFGRVTREPSSYRLFPEGFDMRRNVSAIALAALAVTLGSAPVALAKTTESARASCTFTHTSKSPGETGRGLRVGATVKGGCKVTAKLEKKTDGWHQVESKSQSPGKDGAVIFNFGCHGRAEYRVKLTMSGDSATASSSPYKEC